MNCEELEIRMEQANSAPALPTPLPLLDEVANSLASTSEDSSPAKLKILEAEPELLPTHQFPEFPEEAYIGVLADYAELMSRHYETPKEFVYFSTLLIVGAALSGRVRADFGSLGTQPRLFGVKIGPVGTSKKSTADMLAEKFVTRALSAATRTQDDEFFPTVVDQSSQWMFVLPGAGSGEGVLAALQTNKRVFLRYDELERFAKKANADGSVLGTAVNELFESTRYANATKDGTRSVSGVFLGFSANLPLEQFESTSGAGRLQELGLWSRLIFVVGDRRHRILQVVDPPDEKMKPLVDELAGYFEALPTKQDPQTKGKLVPEREIKLPLTPEARELWNTYENVIGFGPDTTRLDIIGMRLMAILAFTSGKQAIDADVVRAVLAVLKYQKTIRELYKPSRAETIDAKVEGSIMRCVKKANAAGKTPISERNIRRNTSIVKTYGVNALCQGLDRLVTAQMLRRTKTTSFKYTLGPEAD
jgi:hypothetical protein